MMKMYKNKRFTLKGLVEGVPNIADKGKIIDLRCTIESNSQDDYIDYLEKQNERLKKELQN